MWIVGLIVPLLPACDGSAVEPSELDVSWPADSKLLLNSREVQLVEGDTFRLETTVVDGDGAVLVRPGNGAGNEGPRLVWTSSDPAIAAVDAAGLVSAVGEGQAVISVASGSLATTSKTKVNGKGTPNGGNDANKNAGGPAAASVVLTPDTARITSIGGSIRLSARVFKADGSEIASRAVTWASANPEIATVDGGGNVTSRVAGLALIVATAGSAADTSAIRIVPTVSKVVVSPSNVELAVGDTLRLVATGVDAMGNAVSGASFTWNSTDGGVVRVGSTGRVEALAGGTANITATASGTTVKAAASVAVEGAPSAAPVGPSTTIYPGDDIQAKVRSHGSGTVFTIKPGIHRLQRIQPRDGQQFIGEPGAVLNGARLMTGFSRQDGYWVANIQGTVESTHGQCLASHPRCKHPEEIFVNDVRLHHVASRSEVGPGKWYFDYGAGRIYLGDDPTGKKVELATLSSAFYGPAKDVVIRGLVIEKYANPAQTGAIHGSDGRNWVVEDNVVRLNHGLGIRVGDGIKVRNNQVLEQGQLGVGGVGDNVLVEGNEIARNNTAGFRWGWEAGGTKFARTHDLLVRNNHVHDNNGPGLWTDIDNIRTVYEGNRVENNVGPGIFHEISYDAVIRDNTVRGNALDINGSYSGAAGILVSGSGCPTKPPPGHPVRTGDDGRRVCVEVSGNRVEDNGGAIAAVQQSRGSGVYGEHRVTGVWVHDNYVRWDRGYVAVGRDDGRDEIWATAANNRFDRNTYHTSATANRFHWQTARTFAEWQAAGQDRGSELQ